ncbi:solute carrier family 2, facilitated glucose transporter member 6 [Corythoichthys intestinalis]|uniref:solute carrier family 2, facilitated glucose transporter member 6 n=1 Tax=Corythoichthys intestinalis TaxID=161448 RepID=UPI0025A646A8|nr:solute carrier family 2, facilitated glucose transporter member 6 [Corythoichthys intestinalis]XP_061804991.1 solute carrier family 2, facilitated glucose transporter member 6-like [Nerophis lumbriciformis]
MAEDSPLLNRGETSLMPKFNKLKLFLAVFVAVLGNFNFGYSLVYPSPVLPVLQSPDADPRLRMDTSQAAIFGSVYMLGVAGGGFLAMLLNDLIGRKLSIMVSAVPSAFGYLLLGGAVELWMLHLGRFLTGVAGGLTAASIPVYISEISHKSLRGALGTFPQITAVFGALALYALGLVLPWRWLAMAGGVPAFVMVVLLVFMPYSPRRLLSLGREEQAERTLLWLRGADYDIQSEIDAIKHSISLQSRAPWSQLTKPIYYKPILISVAMRFLQQLSGITPILVYLEPIFSQSNTSLEPRYDAAIVGLVRLASVSVSAFLMDKAGRKALLYTSSFLMFLSTLTLTVISRTAPHAPEPAPTNFTAITENNLSYDAALIAHNQTPASSIPIISVVVFIFGYAMGWGPITWLLMSEVLPLAVRGVASGLCVAASWLTAFVLTVVFTHLVDSYGLYVPYFFFTVVSVVCLLFTALCVPETRGRSLEEIENYFRTRRFTINNEH